MEKLSMEDREVITDGQQNSTKGKSYLTNPVTFCDGVTVSVDKGRITVFYLNFYPYFYKIPHNTLLSTWERGGFDEWTVRRITKWLDASRG